MGFQKQLKCLLCRSHKEEELEEQENVLDAPPPLLVPTRRRMPPPPPHDDSRLEQAAARGAAAAADGQVTWVETSAASHKPPRQQPRPPLAPLAPPQDNNHHHKTRNSNVLRTPSQVSRMKERLSVSSSSSSHFSNENSRNMVDMDDSSFFPLLDVDDDKYLPPLHPESAARQEQEEQRRRSKNFRNIHPAHAKIKARLDVYEGRRAALSPTHVEQRSTSHYQDYRRRSSRVPNPAAVVKDCQHDPYEYAYKIWYQKGLLSFRPKGMAAHPPE